MNKVDFSKLTKKREDWVRVSKENSFDEGIKKLLTDLYPDNAHFIYELLQNAEDKEGTEVKFKLVEDELRFTHNGEKFNKEHIDGITSIANGTSVNDINKIGKFGVGFKAVFAYTSTPQIYSGEYCFEISDLVVPTVIESIIPDSSETLMVFPFNNPNKSKEEAYREIYKGLNDIKDNTLLFLTNIKKISYSFGDKIHHIERKETGDIIVNITNSKNRTDRKWLRFKKPLPKKEKLYVSVAFEIVIDKSTKEEYVKSIDDGQVSIFFPAEKEKSNLKFHIHAPFSSTVARDSIKDLEENNELRNLISKLLLDVLKYLKRNQLLDYRFLASMPHDGDNLSEFYLPIQKSIVEYFNKEKFLMTDRGIHRSASECFLINTKEARSVLSKNILKDFMFHFYNRHFEKIYYLDSEKLKYKTRQKSFIEMLEIEKFDDTKLFNILEKLANQKDESIVNMIQGESDKWFKALYVFLNQEKSTYFEDKPQFKKFILLSNETLNTSKEDCYFSQRSDIKELLIVKDSVYFRNPEAKSFLEKLGVKEIGEKEKIEIILKENYQNNFVETDRHLEHIQKFIRFYERHKTDIDFFREYKFIRVSEFDGYKKPEEIYIDSPFEKTGMNAIGKDDKSLFSLNEIYHSLEKEKKKIFIEFLKKLGVITQLSIKEENKLTPFFHKYDIWITKIKKKNKNKNSKFTNYKFKYDRLFEINNLNISLLIWNTIKKLNKEKQNAYYQFKTNKAEDDLRDHSTILHQLQSKVWVPDKNGKFYKPQDISRDMLHNEFKCEQDNIWLQAIELGKNIKENEEEYKKKKQIVEDLTGLPLNLIEELKDIGEEGVLKLLNAQKLKESLVLNQGDGESEEFIQARNNETQILDDERYKKDEHEENKNNQNKFTTSQTNYRTQDLKEVEKVQDFLYKEYEGHCQICGDTFADKGQNTYTMKSLNIGKSRDVNRKGNTLCLCFKHYEIFKRNLQKNLFVDKIKEHEKSTKLEIENADKIFELYDWVGKDDIDVKNDAFYMLDENDNFTRDEVFFLDIEIFKKEQFIKFTKAHMVAFIEAWNEN